MISLKGKAALVTGASRGVGKGVAIGLGEAGARVYLTGRSLEQARIEENLPGTLTETAADVTCLAAGMAYELQRYQVAALAADPEVMANSGQPLVAAALVLEYGFTDVDGKQPRPLSLQDVITN